jgi:hypothetical protein
MRHAGPAALETLADLLARVRRIPGVKEKSRGVFHVKSRACLHFHEDATGLWADLRLPSETDFTRLPASGTAAQAAILTRLEALRAAGDQA